MGSNRKSKFEDYWRTPRVTEKASSPFHNYINLRRFQFIHRLFTASSILMNEFAVIPNINNPSREVPTSKRKLTIRYQNAPPVNNRGELPLDHWKKIESLANYIRTTYQRVYTPETHIIINEIILTFRGRSGDIIKFKNKFIGENFKNWVLTKHDYIWLWKWYSIKYNSEGVRKSLDSRISEEFPEIQRIIIRLALALSANSLNYILYLDNLFIFLPLAKALKKASINIIETTRKNIKGTPQWLLVLKEKNKELI
jgi:hypothetical protein